MRLLTIKKIAKLMAVTLVTAGLAFSFNAHAQKTKAASLDELLRLIQSDAFNANKENAKREAAFSQNKASQASLLSKSQSKLKSTQKKADGLSSRIKALDEQIKVTKSKRNESLGDLKELFGHLKSSAGDLRSNIQNSIVSAQYPNRTTSLDNLIEKMTGDSNLPSKQEIEGLWLELNREMVAQGQVVKFQADVLGGAREVVRVGNFNLTSGGKYLKFNPDENTIVELSKQPSGSLLSGISDLQNSSSGFSKVGIDPTAASGGALLEALVNNTPSIMDRIRQGRTVGYIILGVGALAALIFLWRFLVLTAVGAKVGSQMKSKKAKTNNPLGRVLKVAEDNKGIDMESLELKLEEAVLKEKPKIEGWLNALKIIAMIAPLLGLLGTVTGMINTFQAMTIYGAGDPKAMAGGISSALVTTVLGLVVAIPTVLMHTYLSSKAKRLVQILDERSAGMIAERVEK